jgi:hypothetical protein
MQPLENEIAKILDLGIVTWIVGWRVYAIYARFRESQRGDVTRCSDTQTLFATQQLHENPADVSNLQTVFSSQ